MSHTIPLGDGTYYQIAELGRVIPLGGGTYFQEPPEEPSTSSIYLGSAGRALRYLGTRTDAQLYLGAGTLFP